MGYLTFIDTVIRILEVEGSAYATTTKFLHPAQIKAMRWTLKNFTRG
jgi:hypothetical protein